MIKSTIIQANNDIGLDNELNLVLENLQNDGCKIKDIQFQHASVHNGIGEKPSFAVMIIYETKEEE